ncbi:MAG TPA: PDZ domain-containing protein [Candidatus Sulfotelmatobacter sp.]|nr:PDZ domain-containing protein [Candidatus Sulfotelmatobacter sp.]
MRKYVLASIAIVPLLFSFSPAEQNWSVDDSSHAWMFGGEEGGTTSYLGVDIADINSDRLSALKLKEENGVEVTMVDQDAPAGKAGIKEHDVILTMNGTPIESGAQLRRMIHETPPGRIVSLGLSRDGQPMTVKVQLADKHKEMASWPKPGDIHVNIPEIHVPDIDIPSMNMVMVTSSARSGLMVENITPQLGDFFGVKNGNGVLVRSVEKGSRADKAGFHAGDVVVKVNDQPVHDTSDFAHGMKSRSGNSVNVVVMRDKKEQTLTLSFPSRKESGDLYEEESFFDEPQVSAESMLELSELRDQLAQLQPEIVLGAADSRKAAEEMRKEFCKRQKEFQQQSERQKQKMKKDMQRLQEELRWMQTEWL